MEEKSTVNGSEFHTFMTRSTNTGTTDLLRSTKLNCRQVKQVRESRSFRRSTFGVYNETYERHVVFVCDLERQGQK